MAKASPTIKIASATASNASNKRKRGGKRHPDKVRERIEKYWRKKATTVSCHVEETPGRYIGKRASGKELTRRLGVDYPKGSADLPQAPIGERYIVTGMSLTKELKPTNTVFLRKFANVIPPHIQTQIQSVWLEICSSGVKFSGKNADFNRSQTPSLHLGIWEKYMNRPRISTETWKRQRVAVRALIQKLLELIAYEVAPTMVSILKLYYPEEWARQERILKRVRAELAEELADKPWLDFGGAFFGVAIKTGASEIDHLDWSDDPEALTWVSGVGDWEGADLRTIEMGRRFPLAPGEALLANMRNIVHSASPITSGQRITLTFFTCGFLGKHSN